MSANIKGACGTEDAEKEKMHENDPNMKPQHHAPNKKASEDCEGKPPYLVVFVNGAHVVSKLNPDAKEFYPPSVVWEKLPPSIISKYALSDENIRDITALKEEIIQKIRIGNERITQIVEEKPAERAIERILVELVEELPVEKMYNENRLHACVVDEDEALLEKIERETSILIKEEALLEKYERESAMLTEDGKDKEPNVTGAEAENIAASVDDIAVLSEQLPLSKTEAAKKLLDNDSVNVEAKKEPITKLDTKSKVKAAVAALEAKTKAQPKMKPRSPKKKEEKKSTLRKLSHMMMGGSNSKGNAKGVEKETSTASACKKLISESLQNLTSSLKTKSEVKKSPALAAVATEAVGGATAVHVQESSATTRTTLRSRITISAVVPQTRSGINAAGASGEAAANDMRGSEKAKHVKEEKKMKKVQASTVTTPTTSSKAKEKQPRGTHASTLRKSEAQKQRQQLFPNEDPDTQANIKLPPFLFK